MRLNRIPRPTPPQVFSRFRRLIQKKIPNTNIAAINVANGLISIIALIQPAAPRREKNQ